ncbi:sugar ABC transporter substrate-binding protein [Nocardioides humi]|uniref:Periplasmic binding protein domain-containing protein n=1 Tax=Nocardioides humi TaxID=449461 RepID=A0ABN2AGT3_9ACTN|nr:substrate-binding domain-containing protein [Nocardioides humi]
MRTTFRTAAICLALGLLAACGGQDANGGASGRVGADVLEAARDRVAAAKAAPDGVGLDDALSSRPEKGKTVAFLKCPVATCATIAKGVEAATEALGWEFKLVDFGATPEEQNAAFEKAIQLEPDVIMQTSGSLDTLSNSLAKTKAAGIPVVEGSTSDVATGMGPDGNGIIAVLNGGAQLADNGSMIADWVLVDSDGKNPEVAVFSIPAITVLEHFGTGLEESLKAICEGCRVTTVNAQVADIGKSLPQTVVSHVQQNPGVKYVAFAFGGMSTGVSAALREAGMNDVRVIGETPSEPNLANLGHRTEHAWVGQDSTILGWRMVDAFARQVVGDDVAIAQGALLNNQLLVTGEYEPTGRDYEGYPNYAAEFQRLWRIAD